MTVIRSAHLPPARNVVAVLGPTNTGKTHLAIERMLAHSSGIIGLPLRLLAREVYDRIAARAGADRVALITGEEKIVPPNPAFRVCTVEALPSETDASFVAIDEVQLAADLERGHVFTDRMLNLRGRDETLLLGAATMRGIVERLIPGVNVVTRPRMSVLSYAGSKKITRLPRRSAIVAFSADEVYAIAELIRRQRGGAAVVLGALSPRTRNAQVALYQSGDVDFLVATDAIGMGLNLDVDHVAFASDRKFDGYQFRKLTSAELGQIAGRAGRHMRDGTFGVTGRAEPFEDALVDALESHRFDPVKTVQWRNRDLDFASLDALRKSLDRLPEREGLVKAPPAEDVNVLDIVRREDGVRGRAVTRPDVALVWELCQIPDYRRIALVNHADLVSTLFRQISATGHVDDEWFAGQVAFCDRTDGDIDTLANRIAHIRTWTFVANRPQWLARPGEWQEKTRAIEDRLSDALHERLTQRFVDRRTSVLMRRLKDNDMLETEVTATGDVVVEGQHIGQLRGFRFDPDATAAGTDGKALRTAAQKALAGEIEKRAEKVAEAPDADLILSGDGSLRWQGDVIARLAESDDVLKPRVVLLADETLTGPVKDRVQARLDLFISAQAGNLLKPLFDLQAAADLPAQARGIAFRLVENLGVLDRSDVARDVRELDQEMRAGLRRLGVRFGAYHIYVPALLKPAPARLLALLWALKHGGTDIVGLAELPQLAASGRTSVAVDPGFTRGLYRVVGYRIAGPRAVRLDILERLADLIRPALAWRPVPGVDAPPPPGAFDGRGFVVAPAMTSLLGCAGEDFAAILKALGYRLDRQPAPKPETPAAAETPAESAAPETEPASQTEPAPEGQPEGTAQFQGLAFSPQDIAAAMGAAPSPAEEAPTELEADLAEQAAEEAGADVAEAAETPAQDAAPAEAATETEPQLIDVWRPGGRHDRPARRPQREQRRPDRRAQGRPAPAAPDGTAAPGEAAPASAEERPRRDHRGPRQKQPQHNRRPAPPPRREKPVDPNSPFAALAALKAEMERRKE
jgi:ATP-dependent RNA helicase SUPV3L1/SUV3